MDTVEDEFSLFFKNDRSQTGLRQEAGVADLFGISQRFSREESAGEGNEISPGNLMGQRLCQLKKSWVFFEGRILAVFLMGGEGDGHCALVNRQAEAAVPISGQLFVFCGHKARIPIHEPGLRALRISLPSA